MRDDKIINIEKYIFRHLSTSTRDVFNKMSEYKRIFKGYYILAIINSFILYFKWLKNKSRTRSTSDYSMISLIDSNGRILMGLGQEDSEECLKLR